MTLKKTLLGLTLLLPTLLVQAHEYEAGQLHIDHPWSREMPPVAPTAAAYFVIHNKGSEADRLLSVSTPVAGKAELHEHVHADGVMKMQQVQDAHPRWWRGEVRAHGLSRHAVQPEAAGQGR